MPAGTEKLNTAAAAPAVTAQPPLAAEVMTTTPPSTVTPQVPNSVGG